jgi:ankyrin repeat protein
VSSKHHLIRPVDIATFTQSILASSILNEISATAAPTLQSIYSYIRALIPERYPRDLLSAAEKIFSPSIKEVLQGFLDILILLCSNNFISDQQTYQAASLAFAGGVESRLLSIFSITTPTVTEFANHLFRGALEAEDLDMVRLMIHGPSHSNPSSTLPKRGKTALEFAVARGNIELAKILLEAGASPNDYMQSEYEGRSESREATIRQDLKGNEDSTEDAKKNLARTVRRKGHTYVNPDRFDGSERSSKDYISIARSAAPLDTVEPEDLQGVLIGSSEAKSAGTALQIATKAGSLDIIQLLLDHGADINASPAAQEGMTALQAASRAGSLDVVRRLLEAGADVNASPALHSGMTALQAASRAGSLDIVQLLLDHGADINASPAAQEGMTALQAASRAGSLDVVRCLLEVGADLRSAAESHLGITALQIAVESGNIGIVETLLDAAAQVYNPLEPEYGGVLLRAAASHGYVSIILLLLDDVMSREADIVLPCLETAIEAAAERGRLDMVHLLYSLYKGKYGGGAKFKMAGTLAMRNGHYAVAKLLSTDNMDEC